MMTVRECLKPAYRGFSGFYLDEETPSYGVLPYEHH